MADGEGGRSGAHVGMLAAVGPTVGWLVACDAEGLQVGFPGCVQPVRARSIVAIEPATLEAAIESRRGVLLTFEDNDPRRPIVLGLLHDHAAVQTDASAPQVKVDGKRVVVEGQDEIVLRCGKASITLRRNGRVVIRGVEVETRASGVNRIRGGNVAIN